MATTNNDIATAVNAPGLGGDLARSVATSVGQSELKSKATQAVASAANQATQGLGGGGVAIVRMKDDGKPDRARMLSDDIERLKREGSGQNMEKFLDHQREIEKGRLIEAKKAKDKHKEWDASTMLQAIRIIEKELNTVQKPQSETKKVRKIEKHLKNLETQQKSKKQKKKNSLALTKELFKEESDLPRNPTGNTKSPKNARLEKKAKEKESGTAEKKKTSTKKNNKPVIKKKENKPDEKPLFVKVKTQGFEAWRINIKDESVRRWLYDVYPSWRSILDWKVEPCVFEKIIKENSDNCRYDKYIQPALQKVKASFLRRAIHKSNFRFDDTFDAWAAITYTITVMLCYFMNGPVSDDDKRLIDKLLASDDPDLLIMQELKPGIKERAKYSTLFSNLFTVTTNESMQLVCTSVFKQNLVLNPMAALGEIRTFFHGYNDTLSLFGAFLRGEFFLDIDCHPDYTLFTDKSRVGDLQEELAKYRRVEPQPGQKENTIVSHESSKQDVASTQTQKLDSPQEDSGTHEDASCDVIPLEPALVSVSFPRNVMIVATEGQKPVESDLLSDRTPYEQSKPVQQMIRLPDVTTPELTVSAEVRVVSVDGDLNTKRNRPTENRCFFFHPVFRDPRLNDECAIYAINVQHMAQILGHVQNSDNPREAVQNSLMSTGETNYIMPYDARAYLLSQQMVEIICAYRSMFMQSKPQMASLASCKITEFRMDTKMKLVFHEEYKLPQRAWKLIFTIENDTGAIPLNERTLRYAISKRCKNAFNYVVFCCAFHNLKEYCKLEYNFVKIATFSYEYMFAFVEDFCKRKMLSFNQRLQLYNEAAAISCLFDEDPDQVLTLLQNSLEKETKIFIKDEIYNKDTTPRFIVSPSPTVKIIFGCLMFQIEHYMFSPENPSSKYFIKGLSEDEIKIDLEDFSTTCPEGYVFVENDYISFEGSQPKPAQAIIFGYWFAFTQNGSFERRILNVIYHWVTKYNWLHNKHFSLYRSIMKDSGLNDTSSGNGNLNKKNLRCAMCVEQSKMKVEGDDGVMVVKKERVDVLPKLSMFPCTMEGSEHFYNLSFCGRQLDHNGKYVIQSDKEDYMFDKFNTYFSTELTISDQKRYDMAYMRYLSMCFKYPGEHFVSKIREMINNEFNRRGLHLSCGGVRSYFKQNWYALQNSPLFYLVRPNRFQYPSSVPKISMEDLPMILRAPDPQRRFYEYARFRSEYVERNRSKLTACISLISCAAIGARLICPCVMPGWLTTTIVGVSAICRIGVSVHDYLTYKYKSLNPISECFSQAGTWVKQQIQLRTAVTYTKRMAHNTRIDKLLRIPCREPPISSLFGFHPGIINEEETSDNDTNVDPDLSEMLDKDVIDDCDLERAISVIAEHSDEQPIILPPNYHDQIREYYKNRGPFDPLESHEERLSPHLFEDVDLKASQADSTVLGYVKRVGSQLLSNSLFSNRYEQH